ncbi:MAG: hypothetical protein JO131_04285 [Gammaproteobacteria bacterium]|nr:hypothetical protein [Gammaproteobacteria bacterium]
MPYTPPSPKNWDQFFAEELDNAYIQSLQKKNKSYRINQANLIQSFNTIKNPDIKNAALIGACIHVIEEINREKKYKYLYSSQKSNGILKYYLGLGSTLATKIVVKGLKISESNLLNDREKLIFLQNFYDSHISKESLQLRTSVKQSIACVIGRLSVDIHLLLQKPPTPCALLREFKDIPIQYDNKSKKSTPYFSYFTRKKTNPERLEQIKFIEILSQYCKEDDYALMYGYLLFCMHEIASTSSILYRECAQATNIEEEKTLDEDVRHAYYSKLGTYVSDKIAENKWSLWERSGFEKPDVFFRNMRRKLDKIKTDISSPQNTSFVYPYLNSFTAYAASYGVRMLYSSLATVLGNTIAANGGIVSVFTLLNPEIAAIAVLIAGFVRDSIISNTATGISGNVNALLIHTAKQPIIFTYHSLKQLEAFGKSLIGESKPIAIEDDALWIEALLRVDDSIFPCRQKDIIKRVTYSKPQITVDPIIERLKLEITVDPIIERLKPEITVGPILEQSKPDVIAEPILERPESVVAHRR